MRRLAVPVLAVAAASASAAPAPEESWGKAGVSLAQYRQDAVDCAIQGYSLDISKTDDAKEFVRASRELNNIPGGMIAQTVGVGPGSTSSVDVMADWGAMQQHVIERIRPEERFKNIKQMQLAKTEECLTHRGYSKFRLNDEQRRQLRHLKFGTDQRRAYLYSLGSNPAVLQSQGVTAQP